MARGIGAKEASAARIGRPNEAPALRNRRPCAEGLLARWRSASRLAPQGALPFGTNRHWGRL